MFSTRLEDIYPYWHEENSPSLKNNNRTKKGNFNMYARITISCLSFPPLLFFCLSTSCLSRHSSSSSRFFFSKAFAFVREYLSSTLFLIHRPQKTFLACQMNNRWWCCGGIEHIRKKKKEARRKRHEWRRFIWKNKYYVLRLPLPSFVMVHTKMYSSFFFSLILSLRSLYVIKIIVRIR
jgi:hypothetical protein